MPNKLLLPLALLLTACGQKGPLYLPQDPAAPAQPAATVAAPAAAAPAQEEEEKPQTQADGTAETDGEPALEK